MSLDESLKEPWDKYGIRGLIILSLMLQSFLILYAPLRRQTGGKRVLFVTIPLWIAYLLADWVAVFTIGFIMRAERSGLWALWSSFLLLHLGGPDTMTSFSIEDNKLWLRHLLGLLSRVGSSVYIVFVSLSNDDILWLPSLLVLIAGIIKYAERNRALYLASLDNFGDNWKKANQHMPPVPEQFSKLVSSWMPQGNSNDDTKKGKSSFREKIAEYVGPWLRDEYNFLNWWNPGRLFHHKGQSSSEETTDDQTSLRIEVAVYLLGVLKNLLVGPPLSSIEKSLLPDGMNEMLRAIEIQLSLLYEFLHTKLPVVDSKTGYVCRIINLVCILGALVSFPILLNKYYHRRFGKFDIWLTYGLLIGALALELISMMLLITSDWMTMAHFQKIWNSDKFINKPRWSNLVPQLNIFSTCDLLTKEGGLANQDSFGFLGLRSLLRKIRRNQWVKYRRFVKDQEWLFIFSTLQEKKDKKQGRLIFNDLKQLVKNYIHTVTKNFFVIYQVVAFSLEKFDYMDSLLIWHIVTECCYRRKDSGPKSSSAPAFACKHINHQKISKLLSDYMFYLLVMEPTLIGVSPDCWQIVFNGEDKDQINSSWLMELQCSSFQGNITSGKYSFSDRNESKEKRISRVKRTACELVKVLESEGKRWELIAKIWVWILCYAIINCQPIVHARQVSGGGQLLTLVWLLMNYMELTPSNWSTTGP
ncbi:hypothetical protein SLE2022_320300 [Rubroshorea leprosula]